MSSHQGARVFRSDWGIPAIYAGLALAIGITFPRVEGQLFPDLFAQVSVSAAMSFYSAVASGMITLTGIVFSFTFVMVQFSATAYSPRLVQWISRDPVISHSLGVFTSTFLYAIAALIQVDRQGSGKVPFISGWIVVGLLVSSTAMFIALIRRISLLRVDRMLVFTGDKGREVIGASHSFLLSASPKEKVGPARALPLIQTLIHEGDPCSLQSVDVTGLVSLAADSGGVIELLAAVGDTIVKKTPLANVRGAQRPIGEAELMKGITLGMERTFEQDPKYAIRLLVDIAIKALSPAINDPTTAVQALDQIEDLLLRLGQRNLDLGAFCDRGGEVRLLIPFPGWEDLLGLAFEEVAYCGATSIQVMRRMNALVIDLARSLPEARRPALQNWGLRLERLIDRSYADADERTEAHKADRQGLGAARGGIAMAALCMVLGGLPAGSQTLPPQLKQALSSHLKFTPAEIRGLETGTAAAHIVETGDPEDVLIVGAIRINTSPAEFVARYRNITEFESGPGIPAGGKFSSPPQLSDIAGLSLGKSEWDDIKDCEPGDCTFKSSAAGMKRVRTTISWKSPDYADQGNRLLRTMVLEYVQAYQSKGNTALAAYNDTDKVSRVDEGLTKLARSLPALQQYVPEVADYLLQYPQGKPAGSEDFFYWQVADFGLKPVHRVTHVIIQKKQAQFGDGYLIANKMLYASHYFRSALELRFLVPVQGPDKKTRTYFVVIQRSYVDGLTGFTGKLLRGPVLSKSRDALERYLLSCKGTLEAQSATAKGH